MSNEILDAVRETCVLVAIKCTALGMTRTDKDASRDATRANGAVDGSAKVLVSRLPPGADKYHKDILAAQRLAKDIIEKHTMRYEDEKWRLLPNRRFQAMVDELSTAKLAHDRALTAMRGEASTIIAVAKSRIGNFNIDVPTEDELVNAYSLKTEFQPVPAGTHFRGLPPAVAEKLAQRLEANVAERVDTAKRDVLVRFVGPVENFIERMKKFDEREKEIANGNEAVGRVGVFRDTVVSNIKDIYDVLASFNVTGDDRIEQLGELVHDLANVNADDLRKDHNLRNQAVTRAQEIANNLNEWLNPESVA